MTPLQGTSYIVGRAILAPGRAGRAKIKKVPIVCSCGVQDLSNEPLPIALPALPDEQLQKLPSLLYDKFAHEKSTKKLNCPRSNCITTFISKGDLKRRLLSVHEKLRSTPCDICDVTFSRENELKKHFQKVHTLNPTNTIKCPFCGIEIKSDNLSKHISSVHTERKNYECNVCQYKTFLKGTFKNHQNTVHGIGIELRKNYSCSLCENSYTCKSTLTLHTENVHKKKMYKCEKCASILGSKKSLKIHENIVHKKFRFPCIHSNCDRKFASTQNLNKHLFSKHSM